jgi:Cupin domain
LIIKTRKETQMPKASAAHARQSQSGPGYQGRFEDLGPYTVGSESFSDDFNAAPLFRGLRDDRCQRRHWGIVLRGRLTFRYGDREEVVKAGEAYYAPPGHTPVVAAGTRTVEFTPKDELRQTMEVVMANAAALMRAPEH